MGHLETAPGLNVEEVQNPPQSAGSELHENPQQSVVAVTAIRTIGEWALGQGPPKWQQHLHLFDKGNRIAK